MTARQPAGPGADTLLIVEVVGLLNAAEHYPTASAAARLHYLDTRAALLHRLVDATGCESSRYHAQYAEDRAAEARAEAEALARERGELPPRARQVRRT
ncbi:hypothetical protein ABZ896_20135 [Streptomyces sp. NPDC047072]|uniref:hypothetical protein n=1 Tax=Streptomyces sp. NPDC047072 TaxID=3154809 RepID=UPI0033FE56EF